MITHLRAKNYRSLAELDLSFERLTVLVGHNGSGKSNIVDVLRFVQDAMRHGLDSAIVNRHGMSALRRWSDKGRPFDVEISLDFEITDSRAESITKGSYGFTLGSERRGEYRVKHEVCFVKSSPSGLNAHYETANGQWVTTPQGTVPPVEGQTLVLPLLGAVEPYKHLYEFLGGMSFYNIFPNALTEPQKPANPYPLDEHGVNLASTLREFQRANGENLRKLESSIQAVIPDVNGFQVNQVGGYLVTKLRHEITKESRALFELSQESDGTLRMLGILASLHQDPPRTLIALEEPELTIHPGALSLLWDEIESASDRTQILLTTHSPDLLNMCKADYLRIVEKQDGITYAGPIEETQKQIIQERLFAPGDLLRAQGFQRATQLHLEFEMADAQ